MFRTGRRLAEQRERLASPATNFAWRQFEAIRKSNDQNPVNIVGAGARDHGPARTLAPWSLGEDARHHNIDQDLKLNKALWVLGERMAGLLDWPRSKAAPAHCAPSIASTSIGKQRGTCRKGQAERHMFKIS